MFCGDLVGSKETLRSCDGKSGGKEAFQKCDEAVGALIEKYLHTEVKK